MEQSDDRARCADGKEPVAASVATLSTEQIPLQDRYATIREFYGRISMGVDVAPL